MSDKLIRLWQLRQAAEYFHAINPQAYICLFRAGNELWEEIKSELPAAALEKEPKG